MKDLSKEIEEMNRKVKRDRICVNIGSAIVLFFIFVMAVVSIVYL